MLSADFVGQPRRGQVPLVVRFADRTQGTVETRRWDFGDGNGSDERDPVHEYATEGVYTVGLTVTGPSGTSTRVREEYIATLPDETPPRIVRGPTATDIRQTSATVLWETDERSTSVVEIGTAPDFSDSWTIADETPVVRHAVAIDDLTPATRYRFRVSSVDGAGNVSRQRVGVLFTRRTRDAQPPVITRGPAADEVTDSSARIAWRTNEQATSVVEYVNLESAGPVDLGHLEPLETARLPWTAAGNTTPTDDHGLRLESLDRQSTYVFACARSMLWATSRRTATAGCARSRGRMSKPRWCSWDPWT